MNPLTLKPRQPVQNEIECWDDDEDFHGVETIQIRNFSTTTVATQKSGHASHHRDSTSSRVSARSDFDDEGDWQLLLHNDDDASHKSAIADAKKRGIPIPDNVPPSALLGGMIQKFGGKGPKKIIENDWDDDLEFPQLEEGGLQLKLNNGKEFPDSLRQTSGELVQSPAQESAPKNLSFAERLKSAGQQRSTMSTLEKFRDFESDDFDGGATIKVSKSRPPLAIPNFDQSPPKQSRVEAESFEDDFELPGNGELQLSVRKENPKTPASQTFEDFDMDWAEGSVDSLGASIGGTRRTGRSNRSSSISALSPSVFSPSLSSCLTAESEDEGLDGLVLPDGPLKFEEALRKRLESTSPDPTPSKRPAPRPVAPAANDDFFSGIEIGEGNLFGSNKLTLNRNVKYKTTRQPSPTRRPAMTLTFTNKPLTTTSTSSTRIPKPSSHDRPRSKLEPVSESGGPIPNFRRTQSRLGGHSTQSSISSIPTPTTGTFPLNSGPSTPSRRGLTSRASRDVLRPETTTNSAQLLRSKRSMPLLSSRNPLSPSRTQPLIHRPPSRGEKPLSPTRPTQAGQRPPSRGERPLRAPISLRPKTPVDRSDAESSLAASRRPPVPFLPAGNVNASSHHIKTKSSRIFHRPTSSDASNETVPGTTRSNSRLSNPQNRPYTPTARRDVAPAELTRAAIAKQTLTKPTRRRAYGDGNELDVFDDLPTSTDREAKFTKAPVGTSSKTSTFSQRAKLYSIQNHSTTSLNRQDFSTRSHQSPQKSSGSVPSWARDTAASRQREQRISSLNPQPLRLPLGNNSTTSLTTNWKAHVNAKNMSPRHSSKRTSKAPQKPQLIKPLGNAVSSAKSIKGMHYNPQLFRWEGNENALAPFDVPAFHPPGSPKHGSSISKPALIANVGSVKGVQVVGGMIFDPERMCWLKMGPAQHTKGVSGAASISLATEDDDDPFAGIEALEDETKSKVGVTSTGVFIDNSSDEEVGEEFDVGPSFVRRQEKEEEKWKRKLGSWSDNNLTESMIFESRWEIRSLVR